LALDVPLGWGVNASTTFGGTLRDILHRSLQRIRTETETETAYLKIWEGKKRSKIGAIYDNFRV